MVVDIFDELLETYKEIKYIYKRLCNIECNGFKTCDLFFKIIKSLKEKIIQEEKIFNEFVNRDEYEEIIEEVVLYNGSDSFYLRLKERILFYEIMNSYEFSEFDEADIEGKKNIKTVGKIYEISSKNIFLLYVYFLDSTINKLDIRNLKEKLIKIKYYNCLIKYNLEKVLLDYNFMIPEEIYTDLNFMVDLMGFNDEFNEEVILDCYMTTIVNAIENIMFNIDKEYSSCDDFLVLSINCQCLLKAVFALMSEYEYHILEGRIIDKIREFANDNNLGSIKNILDIMNNRNEYRSKVKKLSLRPLK